MIMISLGLQEEVVVQAHNRAKNYNYWKIKSKSYKSSLIVLKSKFKAIKNQD